MEYCKGLTSKGNPCKRYGIFAGYCKLHCVDLPAYNFGGKCITLTFSDTVENGPGMEKITIDNKYKAFTIDELTKLYNSYNKDKEFIDLTLENTEPAAVLVLRDFCNNKDDLFDDLIKLDWDTKCLMKGQVKNKNARYNLCFADFEQEPDYINGKGRVLSIDKIENLLNLQTQISEFIGYNKLYAEGNYYYNVYKTYIGGHGDRERYIVIGVRFGDSIPLHYRWYHKSKPVGNRFSINLNHGDLYIMSEKAVGRDWLKSSLYTLRHSAGITKEALI